MSLTTYNCIHVIIAEMLKRKGYEQSLLFNQAGLYYEKSSNDFILDPYFLDMKTAIKKYYNLEIVTEEYSSVKDYINAIERLLKEDYRVGVFADIFYLDYCPSFNLHNIHSFEIANFNKSIFQLNDYYYGYEGEIHSSEMIKIFEESKSITDPYQYVLYYLKNNSKQNKNCLDSSDFKNVLNLNYKFMNGEKSFFPEYLNSKGICGLKVIDYLPDLILDYSNEVVVNKVYTALKEVSNSRFQFHNFLKIYNEVELAETYFDSHQNWVVLANLYLKSSMSSNNYENRLLTRLNKLKDQEQKCFDKLRGLLEEKTYVDYS